MHLPVTRKAVVERWMSTPATYDALAREYRVHPSTIRRWTVGLKKRTKISLDAQELIRLEKEEGMRRVEIAAKYKVTKAAVTQAIRRFRRSNNA
jgi:transposase